VLVYYLATGQFPVDGRTLGELKRAHDAQRIKPMRAAKAHIPQALNDVVMRALERDQQLRLSSIVEMQNALTAVAVSIDQSPRPLATLWSAIKSLFAPAPSLAQPTEGARRKLERVPVTNDALQAAMTRHQPVKQWSDQPVEAAKLGTLIDLAFGGRSKARPSLKAYVFATNVDGLPRGVYRYDIATRELIDLQVAVDSAVIEKILSPQTGMRNTAVIVAMCAAFTRGSWRTPQDRDYRMALLDAGHIGQTFSVVATALGLAAFTSSVFNEKAIEELLGLDGVSECPIYVAGVGMPDPAAEG
jgi:SagB-type dehydrogenase family enzyme